MQLPPSAQAAIHALLGRGVGVCPRCCIELGLELTRRAGELCQELPGQRVRIVIRRWRRPSARWPIDWRARCPCTRLSHVHPPKRGPLTVIPVARGVKRTSSQPPAPGAIARRRWRIRPAACAGANGPQPGSPSPEPSPRCRGSVQTPRIRRRVARGPV